MPERWARDLPRRRAAGIPASLQFATKPQLAKYTICTAVAPETIFTVRGGER
jgi:hypothetical protein